MMPGIHTAGSMDRSTLFFWLLVSLLLGGTATFGHGLWQQQAGPAAPRQVVLAQGDVVQLERVLDGDTLQVSRTMPGGTPAAASGATAGAASGADPAGGAATATAELATVRLLGIKAFESRLAKDEAAVHGRAAEDTLLRLAAGQPLRVLLNNPPQDRHGRTLATLYADGQDLGLALVARGHALAYTVYPFAQMPAYLQAQDQARSQRLGLWADPRMADRAEALLRDWRRATP